MLEWLEFIPHVVIKNCQQLDSTVIFYFYREKNLLNQQDLFWLAQEISKKYSTKLSECSADE